MCERMAAIIHGTRHYAHIVSRNFMAVPAIFSFFSRQIQDIYCWRLEKKIKFLVFFLLIFC
jgi:hypothetical protein